MEGLEPASDGTEALEMPALDTRPLNELVLALRLSKGWRWLMAWGWTERGQGLSPGMAGSRAS